MAELPCLLSVMGYKGTRYAHNIRRVCKRNIIISTHHVTVEKVLHSGIVAHLPFPVQTGQFPPGMH